MRRAASVVFVICCAALYFRETVWVLLPTLTADLSDFLHYYRAAQQLLAGSSPFTTYGYVYPPLLAWLVTPLTHFDYQTARLIWFWISQTCLILAAIVMWIRLGRDWIAACVVSFVWACGEAARDSLFFGQVGALLTLVLALAYTSRKWLRSVALGFGIAIKFVPGAVVLALVLSRSWRNVAGIAVIAALLIVLPWLFIGNGPAMPAKSDFFSGTPAILSWSLPSAVLRAIDAPRAGGSLPQSWYIGNDYLTFQLPRSQQWLSLGVAIATLIAGIAGLVIVTGGQIAESQLSMAMAACVALILAALPLSWGHYQVMQYPGVALLLCEMLRRKLMGSFFAALLCSAFLYPLPVIVLRAYYVARGGSWEPAAPATLLFWLSVTPVASLLLFSLMLRTIHKAGA